MNMWRTVAMVALVVAAAGPCWAQRPGWFTVAGNASDAGIDTVQVDPVAVNTSADGLSKTMNVRVSRATQRLSWEQTPYRSYESQVVFNCPARRADYIAVTFYREPLWQGEPHQKNDYAQNRRPMLFRDMEPNPVARIVRAACRDRAG